MKSFFALFFLGILQGLTEFLPVSSSGHLVLFSAIFGVEESLLVSILLHVATLLSICVVFRKDIWSMLRHPFCKESIRLAVATLPTCVIVLILMPLVEVSFSGVALPACFLISAIFLLFAQVWGRRKVFSCQEISNKTAFFMGVAQGLAVFPGISRSGATISAGLLSGADREETAKFSFLMSVPIVALSLLLEVFQICTGAVVVKIDAISLIFAFLAAFLCGILAIKWMIRLTKRANLAWFSAYLLILSIVCLFVF